MSFSEAQDRANRFKEMIQAADACDDAKAIRLGSDLLLEDKMRFGYRVPDGEAPAMVMLTASDMRCVARVAIQRSRQSLRRMGFDHCRKDSLLALAEEIPGALGAAVRQGSPSMALVARHEAADLSPRALEMLVCALAAYMERDRLIVELTRSHDALLAWAQHEHGDRVKPHTLGGEALETGEALRRIFRDIDTKPVTR